ncbi:MAG: tRNA lysidine(34) synthetase TilS [Firmicutes bacterium]|nr:tRNA lysidine(34) synthetase TilS [Bacillota bacterium]
MDAELTVRHTIKKHKLINKGDEVLLGLSGGPDSLCLLHILCLLRFEIGFGLSALHLNHKIRGAEADADAEWVKELCGLLCVPLAVYERDIPAMAKELGITEEDAGRRVRHELLKAEAEKTGAKVALAHNRDDQAETVLLRILRGTGVHGLGAMEYERADGLIRPLLDTPRSEVERYCRDNGLAPRIDSSNAETDYLRNRVRLELLPQLEAYNPNIKESLVRLASAAREDDACLSAMAEEWTERHFRDGAIPVKDLRELYPALFPRVVMLAFKKIGLTSDISSVHIEALRASVFKQEGNKTIEFPRGFEAYKRAGLVHFRRSSDC